MEKLQLRNYCNNRIETFELKRRRLQEIFFRARIIHRSQAGRHQVLKAEIPRQLRNAANILCTGLCTA